MKVTKTILAYMFSSIGFEGIAWQIDPNLDMVREVDSSVFRRNNPYKKI